MAKHQIPLTQEYLKSVLDYDRETGIFVWKFRPSSPKWWNTQWAGTVAGNKNNGYVSIDIDACTYLAHRLAWLYETGRWPSREVDHVNLVRSDNRIVNLREASRSQNASNVGVLKNNTSGFKGVSWRRERKKWKAEIYFMGRCIYLGQYETAEEASEAYGVASAKYHKEFSRTE